MQFLTQYLKQYGGFTFDEKAFCELDALVFSQLAYIDFDGVVENGEITIESASSNYYLLHSQQEIDSLIGISEKAVRLLSLCAKTLRFGQVRICNYVNNINDEIDKQFSGVEFLFGDDVVVAFRGTDITVTGVKESAMLSYMFPVPAQIEALHYFQESAMTCNGRVYACGHSKGGNLAVFACVNCSNSLKKHIAGVYEFDAPGFPKWFFERYDYVQIKDRLHFYAPQSSIFGRMLSHDAVPVVVQSTNSGLKQHQVSSWVIDNGCFEECESFDSFSDYVADYINDLIEYVGEEDLEVFFDTLEFVAENLQINDYYDLKTIDFRRISRLVDKVQNTDEAQKERFKQILKKAFSDFTREYIKSHFQKLNNKKTP